MGQFENPFEVDQKGALTGGFEVFLLGCALGFFMYMSGELLAAYFAFGASFLIGGFTFLSEKMRTKKVSLAPGVKVKGADMMDPIVIEVPKGLPYRIPSTMKVRVNPKWGAAVGYKKISYSLYGMAGKTARVIKNLFGGGGGEEEEE